MKLGASVENKRDAPSERCQRFAELDRLIALDPEPAPIPVKAPPISEPRGYSLRQINRLHKFLQNHRCFICDLPRLCSHREPGVLLAIMERPSRMTQLFTSTSRFATFRVSREGSKGLHGLGSAERARTIDVALAAGSLSESREGSRYLALARAAVVGSRTPGAL